MQFIWEERDIICGRIICKPNEITPQSNLGWHAKHTYKIGWLARGNPEIKIDYSSRDTILKTRADFCLIAMSDGMITSANTKRYWADFLNKEDYIPCPYEYLQKIMEYLKDAYQIDWC